MKLKFIIINETLISSSNHERNYNINLKLEELTINYYLLNSTISIKLG